MNRTSIYDFKYLYKVLLIVHEKGWVSQTDVVSETAATAIETIKSMVSAGLLRSEMPKGRAYYTLTEKGYRLAINMMRGEMIVAGGDGRIEENYDAWRGSVERYAPYTRRR